MNLDLMGFIINLPNQIKDGSYVINLDEYSDIATHWFALYALNNNVTYFNSFGVEKKFNSNLKNLKNSPRNL